MRNVILCLTLVLFCVSSLSCATLDEFFNPPPEPDVEAEVIGNLGGLGEGVINTLEEEEAVPPGHLLGEVELKMTKSEKKYLEDKCSGCHKLDRVFWSHRSPRSVWEEMLNEEQHRKMGLTEEEKERIYEIFQRNLDETE